MKDEAYEVFEKYYKEPRETLIPKIDAYIKSNLKWAYMKIGIDADDKRINDYIKEHEKEIWDDLKERVQTMMQDQEE